MKRSFQWPWGGLTVACGGLLVWGLLGTGVLSVSGVPGGQAARGQGLAVPGQPAEGDFNEETGIFLPSDRLRERQLEQAREALAAGALSDAGTILDDILGGDADCFLQSIDGGATWSSVKAEATRLLDAMPAAGRDAYELQFRARAERMLEQALSADDREQVVAVARRWFHTPSGQAAAVMTALDCLAHGQPLSALAWLSRLSATSGTDRFEPALSLMLAVAAYEAGDAAAAEKAMAEALRRGTPDSLRIAGRGVMAAPGDGNALAVLEQMLRRPGDAGTAAAEALAQGDQRPWLMQGGDPSRARLSEASRPLLAPTFRVPLTRHPDESRLLSRQRLLAKDRERPLLPAAQPVAVGNTVVLRSPLGLLGVDFETGKRMWLQAGRFDDDAGLAGLGEADDSEGTEQTIARGYEDLTTGMLASDGRLLFAVESPAVATASLNQQQIVRPFAFGGSTFAGNVLSAYLPADKGSLAWRLPAGVRAAEETPRGATTPRGLRGNEMELSTGNPWYLGPPLPVGNELYVLVEELGEIRVDVLEAATGSVLWSQPLAELDEARRIEQPGSRGRRLAGLSPSLDDGVLVCPTGAGGVIGIDVATRTLLWAYQYPPRAQDDVVRLPNGMIIRRGVRGVEPADDEQQRWVDSTPLISDGRVYLTPTESEELHCLDTRSGELLWKVPRRDGLFLAGVDGARLVVVGSEGVAALAVGDGSLAWPEPFRFSSLRGGIMPSGRGLLCADRLLLPVDAPGVLEIALSDGSLTAVSSGRDAIPGNLVAFHGMIMSQSIDSLDAFHQSGTLRQTIATAEAEGVPPLLGGGLLEYWKGQLLIDAGMFREGAEQVAAAGQLDPERVTPAMVAAAMLQAMRRDFAATSPLFSAALEACPDPTLAGDMLRVGIDGFLAQGDPHTAWEYWQQAATRCLAGADATDRSDMDAGPVADGTDPLLLSTPSRWLGGRLEAVLVASDPALHAEIGAFVEQQLADTRLQGPREMERLVDLVAAHPAAETVRRQFIDMLAHPSPGQEPVSVGGRKDRQLQLELLEMLAADGVAEADPVFDDDDAWPLGQVAVKSTAEQNRRADAPPLASLPIAGMAGLPFPEGLRLTLDRRQPGMLVHDGYGRQVGGPLSYEGSSQTRRLGIQAVVLPGAAVQPSIVGRLLLVTSSTGTAAFELALPEDASVDLEALQHRRLWHSGDGGSTVNLSLQGMASRGNSPLPHLAGGLPLGTVVSEPRPAGREVAPTLRGAAIVPSGAAVLQNHTLSMRDPISGEVFWSRGMLPSAANILIDASCVCVCPLEGGAAAVYSMHDGRQVGQCDLPPVSDWLSTSGRSVLAIERSRLGGFAGGTVNLVLYDPLAAEPTRFGPFSSDTRAAPAGAGKVALLEPDGKFTVLNLFTRALDFEVVLERMPPGFNQLSLMPWRDRLMVIASRPETAAESEQHRQLGAISGVRTAGLWDAGQQLAPLVTGAVWAVDRVNGESLWSVPATLLRHGFDAEQPADLPVLVFARRIKSPGSTRQPHLSLLCLDKRTGREVMSDDRITTDQQFFYGCEIAASPADHTVTLTHGARDITLTFTGDPVSPRPPYQGLTRPLSPPSLSDKIEEWFDQALEALPF